MRRDFFGLLEFNVAFRSENGYQKLPGFVPKDSGYGSLERHFKESRRRINVLNSSITRKKQPTGKRVPKHPF
jgi:hypothetical protein